MFKSLITLITLVCMLFVSSVFARCCQSVDIEVGWRRDGLDWKTDRLRSSYISGRVDDRMLFKKVDSYTINGQIKWVSSEYYIRFSAEYGSTDKGRFYEHFNIRSPYLYYPIGVDTSEPVKRRSEVYDFDGAVGYPLAFYCCRLSVIPLVGFSFHRQRLRVKEDEDESSSCPFSSSSEFFKYHSSSSFYVSSYNPFRFSPSSNPFSSPSDPNIASSLGLSNPHRTSNYRFTWYGFYLGTDIAYALDSCWTLFWNTEVHFFNRTHRKRKSWTGVYFVDDYHQKGYSYGFNNVVGANYCICDRWYGTLSVDFNWWRANTKHDELYWKKVGAKLGLAYAF